jgi:hypothetical protein
MALQRIDTAFGPNPIRFNGNLQPQANANVWLGNVSSYFNGIYSNQFIGTATHANLSYNVSGGTVRATAGSFSSNLVAEATTVTGNVNTGSFVTRGGAGIAGIAIIGGNLVAAATTASASNVTGAVVMKGGLGISTGGINADGQVILANNFSAADPGNYDGRTFISMKNWTNISGTSYGGSDPRVIDIGLGPSNRAFIRTASAPLELVSGNVFISSSKASTSTTTGALVVVGGIGIGGNINIGGSNGTAIVHTGNILPSANLSYNLGSATAWYNTFYGVSTQARYADLAENYQADAAYAPGTVLEFGGEHEVTVAEDGTRRVAGVVSTDPAHLMNGSLTGTNVVALALQGRVPCRVRGTIRKGDMLVSAGSGFARPDTSPQIGSVIGKALENFSGTEGTIEVVVGRM